MPVRKAVAHRLEMNLSGSKLGSNKLSVAKLGLNKLGLSKLGLSKVDIQVDVKSVAVRSLAASAAAGTGTNGPARVARPLPMARGASSPVSQAASGIALRKPARGSMTMHRSVAAEMAGPAMAVRKLVGFRPVETLPEATPETEVSPETDEPGRKLKARKQARGTTALPQATLSAAQAARLARRDQVVLEHLSLVKAIAVRVHENLPVHVEVDDLVHAGILGLFDAATKFNPEKQVAFSSYAKHRIKGAILDSLRQLDWASRDMRRRHKQVEAATRELAAVLQRNPTEAEIAHKLGMDVARWRNMMLDLRNVGLISASTRGPESDDLPAPDFPTKPESHPDSICSREQLRGLLGDAMKTLPERYQKVVSLYYTNEMTMKEIGGILGINESRVSQIHKSALEKMAGALSASGITSPQAF